MRHSTLTISLLLGASGLLGGAGIIDCRVPAEEPASTSTESKVPKEVLQPKLDVYGDPLPDGAVARLGTIRFRPEGRTTSVVFLSDGKSVATVESETSKGNWGDIACVWDSNTGQQLRRFPSPQPDEKLVVLLSPDGKTLASSRIPPDTGIHLWDVATGKELHELAGNLGITRDGNFHCLSTFSADGKILASVSSVTEKKGKRFESVTMKLRCWDVATGKEIRKWEVKAPIIHSVLLSSDGKILAAACEDTVRLWDVATGKEIRNWKMERAQFPAVLLSSDGKVVATAANDRVFLWDVATGKEISQLPASQPVVAFSPDGQVLASSDSRHVGSPDMEEKREIRLWQAATGKELARITEPDGRGWSFVFSADGKMLASQGKDEAIHLWDVASGKQLRQFAGSERSGGYNLAFSRDGKILASCGYSHGTITLWEVATGKELRPLQGHQGVIRAVDFSRDGKTLFSTSTDNTVRLWEVARGKQQSIWGNWCNQSDAYVFSPDRKTVACIAANDEKTIHLKDLYTGKELRSITNVEYNLITNDMAGVFFSPDGKMLAGYGPPEKEGNRPICLWDVATGKELRQFKGYYLDALALSSDGKMLATKNDTFDTANIPWTSVIMIRLWDVTSGKALGNFKTRVGAFTLFVPVAFSPDGKTIAAPYDDDLVLWDVAAGKELRRFQGHQGMALSIAFSPDVKVLASGDYGHTFHLWEVATGNEIRRFQGHKGIISALSFSPDGKTLASGSQDTTILIWDVAVQGKAGQARAMDLSPKELESLWAVLAGDDVPKAYQAITSLRAAPKQSVPFLQEQLKPIAPHRLADLIADLDNEQFSVREKAGQDLEQLGESAESALRKALDGKASLEVRRRIERLLEKTDKAALPREHVLQALRAVQVLEQLATPEAKELLKKLAEGAEGARLTQDAKASLERLANRQTAQP